MRFSMNYYQLQLFQYFPNEECIVMHKLNHYIGKWQYK